MLQCLITALEDVRNPGANEMVSRLRKWIFGGGPIVEQQFIPGANLAPLVSLTETQEVPKGKVRIFQDFLVGNPFQGDRDFLPFFDLGVRQTGFPNLRKKMAGITDLSSESLGMGDESIFHIPL